MRRLTLQLVVAVVASIAFVVTALTGLVLYAPGRLLPVVGQSLPAWRTVHLWGSLVLALAVATHVVVNRRSVGRLVAGLFRPGPAPASGPTGEDVPAEARGEAAPAGVPAGNDSRMRLTRRRLLWLAAGVAAAAAAAFGLERREQRARGAADGLLADFPVLNIEGGPPATSPAGWVLVVDGLVAKPLRLDHAAWLALPRTQETRSFHCVEGWSVDHLGWEGVRVADLLSAAAPQAGAAFITFYAHDGVYTDTLSLDEAQAAGTLLADRLDGAPLPPAHGGPLRLVVPSQLGYKSVKWVVRVELTTARAEGYWERRGYPAEAPAG